MARASARPRLRRRSSRVNLLWRMVLEFMNEGVAQRIL
jgi:hypothetical protein